MSHHGRPVDVQEMLENGARLCEILKAGDWRSAAFMSYLDEDALEAAAALEAVTAADEEDGN
eukprot:9914529-Karenia_brevis.AAC.1